jgi:glycosyltransferase involved in cell wall biosynthesis
MKICFLLHQGSMYSGGQGVYLHYISREITALGHDVHVIGAPPFPDLAEGVTLHKLPTYSIYRLLEDGRAFFYGREPSSFFNPLNFYELATTRAGMFSNMNAFSFRAYGKVCDLSREHRFDIVHDVQVLGYGCLLIKASGLPVVANIHHPLQIDRANSVRQAKDLGDRLRWLRFYPFWMQEVVARRLDRIITGSKSSGALVAEKFRLREEKIEVIYDGVDTDLFRPMELNRDPNAILFVGNSDDHNKGIRYLLEALALLRKHVDLQLTVVDREDAHLVPALSAELGISDRVSLTGRLPKEDLARAYNRAQLLVSPSVYEGFGLPAAEAMSCGTPVIATTAGAFMETIVDGESGVLVPPADPRALAGAIEGLLSDDGERRRLGAAGRDRIERHFSWRETALRTLALYEDVLQKRRMRRLQPGLRNRFSDGS